MVTDILTYGKRKHSTQSAIVYQHNSGYINRTVGLGGLSDETGSISANRSIEALTPRMQNKVRLWIEKCHKEGLFVKISETLRTKERQHELYGYGRSNSEMQAVGCPTSRAQPNRAKVTYTMQSQHLDGIALDFFFDPNEHGSAYPPFFYNLADGTKSLRTQAAIIAYEFGMLRGIEERGFDAPHLRDNGEELTITPQEEEKPEIPNTPDTVEPGKRSVDVLNKRDYALTRIVQSGADDEILKTILGKAREEIQIKFYT